MIKNFVALPNEKIRGTSDEIVAFDKSLKNLVRDLIDTSVAQANPPALGLAAPQIDVFKRVFVALIRKKFRPFVNARIVKTSKEEGPYLEGCFSVPGIYGQVTRPLEVTIEAQDINGKKISSTFKGLAAKIIQHETDHLDGKLFVDHVYEQNGKLFKIETDKEGNEQLTEIPFP